MLRQLVLCLACGLLLAAAPKRPVPKTPTHFRSKSTVDAMKVFLQRHGGHRSFSAHYMAALSTFVAVETLYDQGKYKEAQKRLARLWVRYPMGDVRWYRAGSAARGTNVGRPVAYYALRMLRDMLRFRLTKRPSASATEITMTVVLVRCLEGRQPTTWKELKEGRGKRVSLRLDPRLQRGGQGILTQASKLFRQYVYAITKGRLRVSLAFQPVSVCVQGHAKAKPYRVAGVRSLAPVWSRIPKSVRDKTSWWWVVYPSMVPAQYPDFRRTEFITGGMGVGPDGASPCFIADDQWVLRKPPHLGQGAYTQLERKVYLPQWFQHEFFHHLFRIYPLFGLEKKGHQWFNRKLWPADFRGRFEPDYYAEALAKRLQTPKAQPPLHVHLRYEKPPASLYRKISPGSLLGRYQRRPVTNRWHNGVIERRGGSLLWRNQAGVHWGLKFLRKQGELQTGPKCPYRRTRAGQMFRLSFARDANGHYTPKINGFYFNGELYHRLP